MKQATVSLDALLDLVAALRQRGWRISAHQVLAARSLLFLLRVADAARLHPAAAAGADAEDELRRHLAPVFCTTAREQRDFKAICDTWRGFAAGRQEVGGGQDAPPPQRPPRLGAALAAATLVAALAIGMWQTVSVPGSPVAPPGVSTPAQPSPGITPAAPAVAEAVREVNWGAVAAAAMPALLWAAWLRLRAGARPRLQRGRLRTPPALHSVYLPGGLRSLWPGLPLRRLAQALRSRRSVDSQTLLIEPTIAATLKAGGAFVPVRGARAEPEYLVLVDRASASDHVALLADELTKELQASDVQLEHFDLDVASGRTRVRLGQALPLVARTAPVRSAVPARAAAEAVPAETRLHAEAQRVLVFSDGEGFFDGYTGEPHAWLLGLLAAPMLVLVTPVPAQQWGERERALEKLGVMVFELSQAGLAALIAAVDGSPAAPAESRSAAAQRSHEGAALRWLQRDLPAAALRRRLLADLQRDLGGRGFAWLAACAAYPEVNFGITLRLGAGLVPEPALFATLLTALSRTVWMRRAYMPDWLRHELLATLPPAYAAQARQLLLGMLDGAQAGGDVLPLRIGLDDCRATDDKVPSTLAGRLRAWVRAAMRRDAVQRNAKDAAADARPVDATARGMKSR